MNNSKFGTSGRKILVAALLAVQTVASGHKAAAEEGEGLMPKPPTQLFPLSAVRLLDGPFAEAAEANRTYLLAHDPDRLLAPFLREAGLDPKKPPYPNWESQGLDGHTAGHYLSALADMIASGHDGDGQLGRRLDYMLEEMGRVQQANGNGYIGGVPGSRAFWKVIAGGDVKAIRTKWVPWYNVHKTFAGLRDAYIAAGRIKARDLLVHLADWCLSVTTGLSDVQMQQMLDVEHGGMNEVLADVYAITGDRKYLVAAERFNHHAVLDPLIEGKDKLTGLHANTQIPKVIGLERIAALTGNQAQHRGADFFWHDVVEHRTVAFGGNSVSEHFHDPANFRAMLEHREGPETCNTYNMLRLTEQLFEQKPDAAYADFYERALFNHLLSSIDPKDPGFVYFTPIRPEHYRVYSTPEQCFWCCVGTGMENPGRYGQFIYAQGQDGGLYVNLFIPSELRTASGLVLRQEGKFPFEPSTHLKLSVAGPSTFALRIRHPWWVPEGQLTIRVNGQAVPVASKPTSYAEICREWKDGDTIDVDLPMHLSVERLPDGSDWAALLEGPIVLAAPDGTEHMAGERAGDGRMSHIAGDLLIPLDRVPVLVDSADDLAKHVVPDPAVGPLRFRIQDVVDPKTPQGVPLMPFFQLHHERYQMYWELVSADGLAARRERLAAEERTKAAREAATLDSVAVGEQQSEVEHGFKGGNSKTGLYRERRWRGGSSLEYTLDPKGATSVDLAITYWGADRGTHFDILVNDVRVGTETQDGSGRRDFIEKRYPIPEQVLAASKEKQLVVRLAARGGGVGSIYDLRLMKSADPAK